MRDKILLIGGKSTPLIKSLNKVMVDQHPIFLASLLLILHCCFLAVHVNHGVGGVQRLLSLLPQDLHGDALGVLSHACLDLIKNSFYLYF